MRIDLFTELHEDFAKLERDGRLVGSAVFKTVVGE